MMEGAASLIYFDTSDKLRLNQDGLRALKKIPDDYGIVSVSMLGHGRIGKSSLLNQLAEKNVFEVGSTTTRVTKGIWIYIKLDHSCKRAYMYCDVEGFGDPTKDNCDGEDKRLLVIICQICDMIVFNIKGVYDSDLLQKLMFTCVLFEKYRKKNKVLSKPGLAAVLRDFDLDPPESPDDELRQLLQSGNRGIPISFRLVRAFQLVRPTERKQLRDLKDLPDSALDSDFVKERNRLHEFLKSEAKPLCSQTGKIIPGEVLAELIQETIKAVNSDNLGNITQTLPDILLQNNQRLKEAALQSYEQQVTSNWPSTSAPETLQTSLQTLKKKIKDDLDGKLIEIGDSVSESLHDFETKTGAICDRLSRGKCESELARVNFSFDTSLSQNAYSVIGGHERYLSEKRRVETKYKRLNNLGPRADSVWRTYETKLQAKETMIKDQETLLLREQRVEREIEQARQEQEEARRQQEHARIQLDRLIQERREAAERAALINGVANTICGFLEFAGAVYRARHN